MDAVEAAKVEVHAWFAKLAPLTPGLTASHVVIAVTDERREGRLYHVNMELFLPGGTLLVEHGHPRNGPHEDIYVAIRNAFRAARQQIEVAAGMPLALPPPAGVATTTAEVGLDAALGVAVAPS
jgi:putative sigma-54 modulation protein